MTPEQIRNVTRYVDRPEVSETYADSVEEIIFDGIVLKIDLATVRWDDVTPPKKPSGKRVTSCRLVLSANGALELANRLTQIMQALEKTGAIRTVAPTAPTSKTKQ